MSMIGAFCLLGIGFVGADGPPVFQATAASVEKPIAGLMQSLDTGWALRLDDNQLTSGDLIELIQVGIARPNYPWDRPHVLLVNGDRWPGHVSRIKDDQLHFVPAFGTIQELTIPVSNVALVWLKSPRTGVQPDPSSFDLIKSKRNHDEVFLENQDKLTGTVTSIVGPEMRLDLDGKIKLVPVDRIAAIAFNTDISRPKKSVATHSAYAVLSSGARITLTELQLQDGRLVGKTSAGPNIRILLSDLVSLSVRSSRVSWLDDIQATKYQHTPFLSTKWPLAIGRNTAGGPLRVGPHVFDFGIGLHSQCEVTFSIPTNTDRFETWLGLDSEAGRKGLAAVSIKVDGKLAQGPIDIAGSKPPMRIILPNLKNSKEITLVVEFGGGGDVQDHVNWVDARFIRSGPSPGVKP